MCELCVGFEVIWKINCFYNKFCCYYGVVWICGEYYCVLKNFKGDLQNMKTKIIKKILASLLIAATISTVSGAVGAIPPHPKKYAQELAKKMDEDWANSFKTDEAKKV